MNPSDWYCGILVLISKGKVKRYCYENFKKYTWDLDKDSSLVKDMSRFKSFGKKKVADFIKQSKYKSKQNKTVS